VEKASVVYSLLNALGFELFELYPIERSSIIAACFKTVCRTEEIEDSCKKRILIARFSANILTGKSADVKPDCVIMHFGLSCDNSMASSKARYTESAI
jgi:hypothetical protein